MSWIRDLRDSRRVQLAICSASTKQTTVGGAHERDEAEVVFRQPCNFRRWPQIPMRVIASANDRFFPLEFQRRIARSRFSAASITEPLPPSQRAAFLRLGIREAILLRSPQWNGECRRD